MRLRLSLGICMALCFSASASALEPEKDGLHLGALMWAEEYCPGDTSERFVMLVDLYKTGDPADAKKFEAALERSFRATRQLAVSEGHDAVCDVVVKGYGPRGKLLSGFWIPKG
jgi:hypothetical protein